MAGVRVIDFTHFIAGPLATMMLADLGADVVKIESPGRGDEQRHFPPLDDRLAGQGPTFLWANRNKRSIVLDLKTPAGRSVALDLIAKADVLVENFSSGVMAKFGFDRETLAEKYPRLIYCSVSAYGRTGDLADRTGFDTVLQAESGFMSINGFPDREPVRSGSPIIDISTGMMASNVILSALHARNRTGKGQFVEVSLYDTSILMTGFATVQHLFAGTEPGRHGNVSKDSVPTGVFQASDGPFYLVCGGTPTFRRLFRDALGMPEIADDPAFASVPGRIAARDRIFAILEQAFASDTRERWLARLRAASVPAGAVRTIPEALRSDETHSRGIVTEIPHPTAGLIPNIGLPIHLSDTPVVSPVAAPLHGEHTKAVLEELGWSQDRYAAAEAAGAFGSQTTKQ